MFYVTVVCSYFYVDKLPRKDTWLQEQSSEESHVQLEGRLHLLYRVVRIRQQFYQPSSALLQVRNDLEGLAVVGEHFQLKVLGTSCLEGISVEPVRHLRCL